MRMIITGPITDGSNRRRVVSSENPRVPVGAEVVLMTYTAGGKTHTELLCGPLSFLVELQEPGAPSDVTVLQLLSEQPT